MHTTTKLHWSSVLDSTENTEPLESMSTTQARREANVPEAISKGLICQDWSQKRPVRIKLFYVMGMNPLSNMIFAEALYMGRQWPSIFVECLAYMIQHGEHSLSVFSFVKFHHNLITLMPVMNTSLKHVYALAISNASAPCHHIKPTRWITLSQANQAVVSAAVPCKLAQHLTVKEKAPHLQTSMVRFALERYRDSKQQTIKLRIHDFVQALHLFLIVLSGKSSHTILLPSKNFPED